MTDAEKRGNVIRGLECCLKFFNQEGCPEECPYRSDGRCYETIKRDALALLKEQEPRVLTIKEVETSKGFVWVEFHSINENRLSLEYVNVRVTERFLDSFVLSTDSGIEWLRNRGDYNRGIWFGINSGWRCWTSRPTEEQRRKEAWDA